MPMLPGICRAAKAHPPKDCAKPVDLTLTGPPRSGTIHSRLTERHREAWGPVKSTPRVTPAQVRDPSQGREVDGCGSLELEGVSILGGGRRLFDPTGLRATAKIIGPVHG